MTDPKVLARQIFDAGVAAADPEQAVRRHLPDIAAAPALIVAVGKAARRMTAAALSAYPGTPALVVTNYENASDLPGAEVLAAGHPVPDANGAAAAQKVLAALHAAKGPVLALISGGGSALLPAPTAPITLDDKAALNALLLAGGLDITQMNLIRQQVSDLKGGGMLRAAAPNPVTALILSDVVGDDLSTIASGPTVAPLGSAPDAVRVLKQNDLWSRLPPRIAAHLMADHPDSRVPDAQNILVGSNAQSVAAMAQMGRNILVIADPVEGDVRAAATVICDQVGPGITVWGGETTVHLRGDGRGGRNQELALWVALEARTRGWEEWVCLQGGSDGRDGPVEAAGGLVDQTTLGRIAQAGGDINALLANNDSNAALALSGDLLMTGATGTNVADLGVMIRPRR